MNARDEQILKDATQQVLGMYGTRTGEPVAGKNLSRRELEETVKLLDPAELRAELDHLEIPARLTDALVQGASRVLKEAASLEFITLLRNGVYSSSRCVSESLFSSFPVFTHKGDEILPMLYALAFASGLRSLRRYYERRGIPESILRDTMTVFSDCIEEYEAQYGVPGLGPNGWLLPFVRGQGFKLGRLQFIRELFPHSLFVFQHTGTGEELFFLDAGRVYGRDGSLSLPENGTTAPPEISSAEAIPGTGTELHFEPGLVSGFPVFAGGKNSGKRRILNLEEWGLLLARGHSGLSVHVPARGRLLPDLVKDSFSRSKDFFRDFFPDYPVHAWFITSWLLDPQLRQYLPKDSNILRFQELWHAFPIDNGGDEQFFKDVFPGQTASWEKVKADTSLQTSLIEHVRNGGTWHEAGGFILPL